MALMTFNREYYLLNNPDVEAAIRNGWFTSAEEHYVMFGEKEGRQPSAFFDPAGYFAANQDVEDAVTGGVFSTSLEHFEQFGVFENRAPGRIPYDEAFYLSQNPDVAAAVAAGTFSSGFEHYANFGAAEGRLPTADSGPDFTTFTLTPGDAAGAAVMGLTGDQMVRIDFTNPANQVTGQDLNGDSIIARDGVENAIQGVAANFEIVDAYARNPLNQGDIVNNYTGDIAFDGTGFAGDGVSTDGNIYLGGLGVDTAFGGIGNDFLVGGGVAAARFAFNAGGVLIDTRTGLPPVGQPGDQLSGGRNADFFFAELAAMDPTDGNGTLYRGGNTTDDSAAGLPQNRSGWNSQNNDWILVEASDDNEPTTVHLLAETLGTLDSGTIADIVDIESVDASGNLYGFLNDIDVMLGGRATDLRSEDPVVGTENYGIGSTAQLAVTGSAAANVVIGGYDNDSIFGGGGDDILFGGSLRFLLQHQNNPNLLDADGGLDLNVVTTRNADNSVRGEVVNDGRDVIDGGDVFGFPGVWIGGDDHIVFEMDGGTIIGGEWDDDNTPDATTSGDTNKDTGDTLWLTDFSMGRLRGAVVADEPTAQQDALAALTTDSRVRIDLGVEGGQRYANYGGSNTASQDQTNYATGASNVAMTEMESVIATGLGQIDFRAAGNNSPELSFNNQQNFLGINADMDLRGNDEDNTLYANTGNDVIEGRGGDDNLSGGRGDDTFVVAFGDGVDTVHRQLDLNGDNLWDSTAGRNRDGFGQDFRAPQEGDIASSRLTVDFGTTDIGSPDVAVSSFQIVIDGVTFAVTDIAALAAAATMAELAAVVNAAYSAIDPDVSATAVNNTVIVSDVQGREMSDTIAEGFLVGVVLSNGSASATATFAPGGTPINVVEDDVLIIRTYEDRSVNLGANQQTTEIGNAADMVVRLLRDDAGTATVSEANTILAEGQETLVRVTGVGSGDRISVVINGKEYSHTVTTGQSTAAAVAALVLNIVNELDLNSGSGQVFAQEVPPAVGDPANFPDTDGGLPDVAVFSLTQTAVGGSQAFMDVSVSISNATAGGAGGRIELHNQSNTFIDLVEFPGYNNGLNGDTVQFLGRGANTVSLLETALDAGDTLTGLNATLDADTPNTWINGDDLLIGGLGNDTINGGTGDDVILVSQGTDTVDGGGNATNANGTVFAFNDVLQVEQSLFGAGSTFTVALAGTLGARGAGTVTMGGTASGVTTFTGIETVRVLENSRDTTLDVSALSNSVAAAVGNNVIPGVEGLVVNLTRVAPSVSYSVDNNNDGDVTDPGDYNNFLATQVYGAENVLGGNANDTVNVDASQAGANNRIDLGAQQSNANLPPSSPGFVEGADLVNYTLGGLPAGATAPTMTLAVEAQADTDTVAMTGGILGATTTTDTLINVEQVNLGAAATGLADVLNLSALAGGTVNYGPNITVGATLGGGLTPNSVANVEANTLESGGVSTTGTGLGNERLEIGGILQLERVTGSAGMDRVITSDDMGVNDGANARIAAAPITFQSYLAGLAVPQTTITNLGLFQYDLGAGDNDMLDYYADVEDVAVVVDTTGVDGAFDRIISGATNAGALSGFDRVDYATNVERYFGGQQGAGELNIIDLSAATVATTIQFSRESATAGNEFAEPNGAAAGATDLVRGAEVRNTASGDVYARFMDRTAANPAATASFWNQIQGSALAETVLFTDLENAAAHTLNLGGGENVANYSALTAPVTAAVQNVSTGPTPDTQQVLVAGDTVTVNSANYAAGQRTLTVIGSTQNGDIVDISDLDAAGGATIDTYNLVDLAAGVVVEDVLDAVPANGQGNVIHVTGFENILGSDSADRLYGSGGVNDIAGGLGNDWIVGRGGASTVGGDRLTGGLGNDRFIYETENDSATATPTSWDRIVDFGVAPGNTDVLVFNTTDGGAVRAGAAPTVATPGATVNVMIDQNGDGDTVDAGDDDYSITDLAGTITAASVLLRVGQSAGQDIQRMDAPVGGVDGQFEVVYTAASQSNNLALPDEFHWLDIDSADAGIGNNADKFDLRAFNFGSGVDANTNGVADAIESILYSTPVTVNSLTSVDHFFREGAVATGVARAVHVQLEPGSSLNGENMRVFVDVNRDGNYTQADDLVFDLVDLRDASGAYAAGLTTQTDLYNDPAAGGAGNGIFIFTDAQYDLWYA